MTRRFSLLTVLRTRTLPWFGLAALLFVLGLAAFAGTAQGMAVAAAMFLFLGACIRGVGLSVRDNPVGAQMLAQRDVIHGSLLSESAGARRRR